MSFHTIPDRTPGLCFLYMIPSLERGGRAATPALGGEGNIPIFPLLSAFK